jgi:hypothetical protein
MSTILPTRTPALATLGGDAGPGRRVQVTACASIGTTVEVHFCYVHQSDKPVAGLSILVCNSSADLAREVAALKQSHPLARIETVREDRLGLSPASIPLDARG